MIKRTLLGVTALLLGCSGLARGDAPLPSGELATFITSTMTGSTSSFRKESYQSAAFDGCTLHYTVSGTYPSGGLYTIRFRGIDFSTLDSAASKVGQDYTDYVVLRFDKPFSYASETDSRAVNTTVINVAERSAAEALLDASLRLAAQCRTAPSQTPSQKAPPTPPGTALGMR